MAAGGTALAITLALLSRRDPQTDRAPPVAAPAAKVSGPVVLDRRKLAVLPFDNFSSEKEKSNYFADGMTDQMTSSLSRVSGLTVKSRNAILNFLKSKGPERDIRAIGRELGVGSVLESSVRREGNRLRITVQLIDVQTLDHIWSADFDKTYDEVLTIQSDVAERVAVALKGELLNEEKRTIRRRLTGNLLAYDFYLQGRYNHGGPRDATETSIVMLEKAIALDGSFAEAHAILSQAYGNKAYFLEKGDKELEAKSEKHAAQALELNPDLPEAHLAQARILWRPSNGYQHGPAIMAVRRALALKSNMDEAWTMLGDICYHVGLIDQARVQYQKAIEINPGNPNIKYRLAQNELYQGRYDNAIAQLKIDQITFTWVLVEFAIARAYFHAGRTNEARARVEDAFTQRRNDPIKLKDEGGLLNGMQALLLAADGDKAQAEAKIKEALQIGKGYGHFHHTQHVIAAGYSLLNEPDLAMKYLRDAAENGFPNITWFRRDPSLANLRNDPRFELLMAELQPQFERLKRLVESPIGESKRL